MNWTEESNEHKRGEEQSTMQIVRETIILKKDAALEVYLSQRTAMYASLVAVLGVFIILILPKTTGFIVAIAPVALGMYFFVRAVKRMNVLNEKYNLGFKKYDRQMALKPIVGEQKK